MNETPERETVDLLPCPFCGGSVDLVNNDEVDGMTDPPLFMPPFFINCCAVMYGRHESELIAAWNARADAGYLAGVKSAEWVPVSERLPEDDGSSYPIIEGVWNGGSYFRELKVSRFRQGRFANPFAIAWLDAPPYQEPNQ
jgi:hypothetical protein